MSSECNSHFASVDHGTIFGKNSCICPHTIITCYFAVFSGCYTLIYVLLGMHTCNVVMSILQAQLSTMLTPTLGTGIPLENITIIVRDMSHH